MSKAAEAIIIDENFGPKAAINLEGMPSIRKVEDSGVPDVPHAVNVSLVAEGNGVGSSTAPPVSNAKRVFANNELTSEELQNPFVSTNLTFKIRLTEQLDVTWDTVYYGGKLFVELPNGILPEGSKEGLIMLLEYAEETLHCSHVIICFKKSRPDRGQLVRIFRFLGFDLTPPGDPLVPDAGDLMFLAYTISRDDDDSD